MAHIHKRGIFDMTFERDELVQRAVDAVVARLLDMERGQIIDHATIQEITGLKPMTPAYYYVARKALRRLQQIRGIASWPIAATGWKLLTKQETFEMLPEKRRRKASRQIRRLRDSLAAMPNQDLTPLEARIRDARLNEARRAQREIRMAMLANQERPAPPMRRPPGA